MCREPADDDLQDVPLSAAPEGCRLVGAMDGWTTVVPALDAELARVDRTQRRETAED